MSTPLTFVVWAPDMSDLDALQRRLSVRTQHLAKAKESFEAGVTSRPPWFTLLICSFSDDGDVEGVGGALVTPETHTAEQKKMIGSLLIIEAESLEAVRKMVESDIYYTSNVVRSLPFRFGLEYSSYCDSLVGQGEACHLTLGFGTSFAVIRVVLSYIISAGEQRHVVSKMYNAMYEEESIYFC